MLLRKLALQEKTVVQMVLNNAFFLVTAGIPMIHLWRTPSIGEAGLLAIAGTIAGIAQFTLFERAENSI